MKLVIYQHYSAKIESIGTGDAVSSAIIVRMLTVLTALESIRLGAAAVSLTLQSPILLCPALACWN